MKTFLFSLLSNPSILSPIKFSSVSYLLLSFLIYDFWIFPSGKIVSSFPFLEILLLVPLGKIIN
jgi:hypothetical protein